MPEPIKPGPPSAFSLVDILGLWVSHYKKWKVLPAEERTELAKKQVHRASEDLVTAYEQFGEGRREIARTDFDITPLWRVIGAEDGTCRSCGQPIKWVKSKNGKATPMNPWGTTHFQTCPEAEAHRKKK